MLLAADIGNTNITLGLFEDEKLVREERLETARRWGARALARRLREFAPGPLRGAVFGTVVPALRRPFADACRAAYGAPAVEVTPRSRLGIRLKVRTPREVGADRLLNAVAAHHAFRGPAIVIDFGTATTFDCVSAAGDYLGGAILPGPRLAAKALRLYTAQLPEVAVRRPARAIGRDTVECIQGGLYFGYLGMIERVLRESLAELRKAGQGRPRILATGGVAHLFASELPQVDRIIPDLTLQGLRISHEILTKRVRVL